MATLRVGELGEYIRDQRRTAQISLRQLAKTAGVSNPYLSQIERGLRKPSAEILQQIAKALRISAEALYIQAGILEERGDGDAHAALLADPALTERQKQVLIEIYDSFRKENAALAAAGELTPAASAKPVRAAQQTRKSEGRKAAARQTETRKTVVPAKKSPARRKPTTTNR